MTEKNPAPRRSFTSRVGDGVLQILALGGIVCIGLVICAFAFNITLVMFKTGSMSPTIPTGSLAVVRAVPADTVRVGEVVTVNRGPGELPVTHRVVSVESRSDGVTVLDLKGDDNPQPDPAPYEVTEVRKVLWHVPGLARVIVYFSNPVVLGLITVAMSALVVAVFWPRNPDGGDPDEPITEPIPVVANQGREQL
ncbi:signal peptidase [Rhodococcus sp. 27YEA15]|uniref:signal peptidase I n=1 Tax=Rhodococcus sp. 27YEA15 TaxID=3156259 RepID=UPI003C79F1A9